VARLDTKLTGGSKYMLYKALQYADRQPAMHFSDLNETNVAQMLTEMDLNPTADRVRHHLSQVELLDNLLGVASLCLCNHIDRYHIDIFVTTNENCCLLSDIHILHNFHQSYTITPIRTTRTMRFGKQWLKWQLESI